MKSKSLRYEASYSTASAGAGSAASEFMAQIFDEIVANRGFVAQRRAISPDRSRPRGVSWMPRDDVDVQLRDDVAECSDIDPCGLCHVSKPNAGTSDFLDQYGPIRWIEFVDLRNRRTAWNEDQPGKSRIVGEQQPRQRPVGDKAAFRGKAFVKLKHRQMPSQRPGP